MTARDSSLPACVPLPPWKCAGEIFFAFVTADRITALPHGFAALASRRLWAIVVIRYRKGPLHYDELVVGPVVRHAWRPGILVRHIWVNDAVSLDAGRHIWGLPKKMGRFTWTQGGVTISDDKGLIAQLRLHRQKHALPALPLISPGFGLLHDAWLWVVVKLRAPLALANIEVLQWSPRFGFQPRPLFAFSAERFDATIEPPRRLGSVIKDIRNVC